MSTVVSTIVSIVLFLGGMYLFAFAFQDPTWPDLAKALIFVSGIAAISISIAIPAHALANNEHS